MRTSRPSHNVRLPRRRSTTALLASVALLTGVGIMSLAGTTQPAAAQQATTSPPSADDAASGDKGFRLVNRRARRVPRPSLGIEPILPAREKAALAVREASGRVVMPQIGSWVMANHVDQLAVRGCRADFAVIDYSADGSEARAFSKADIESMKAKPDGRRMLLAAYMSIGEAEDYRDLYWRREWLQGSRPAWLGPENPDWKGNFRVRYWDADWQRHIFGSPNAFLDRIIAAGFDGVYLDIVDGFEYWQSGQAPGGARAAAAEDMINFVSAIARYAWSKKPGFLIIPQNGEALLEDPGYRAHISAIGTEDVFFRGVQPPADEPRRDDVERQLPAETARRMAHLERAITEKIPVLSIEYLMDAPEDAILAGSTAVLMRQRNVVPHFAVRQLDRLQCAMAN